MKKLFAVLLLTATTHVFAQNAAELPVWQSADEQRYDDPNLDAEAFWFQNGDTEFVQKVYRPAGVGDSYRNMMGRPAPVDVPGGEGSLKWVACTPAMLSPTPQSGFVQTPRG